MNSYLVLDALAIFAVYKVILDQRIDALELDLWLTKENLPEIELHNNIVVFLIVRAGVGHRNSLWAGLSLTKLVGVKVI